MDVHWNFGVEALQISGARPNVDPMAQCETSILKSSQTLLNEKREGTIYAVYPIEEALEVGSRSLKRECILDDWSAGL